MDRDEKGWFLPNNKVGHLAQGVPKPLKRRTFKTVQKAIIENYTPERIIELIESLPENQQVYYIQQFTKDQQNYTIAMMKLEMDRLKMMGEDNNNQVITIRLPDDDEAL